MVDVSGKTATRRLAQVEGYLCLSSEAVIALEKDALAKGDPFTVAKIAGILGAKRTSELIPLCHPLPIEHVEMTFQLQPQFERIRVLAETVTTSKTGIELEAFTAATVALLSLYDMIKAVDPAASITGVRLLKKTGGKSIYAKEKTCALP